MVSTLTLSSTTNQACKIADYPISQYTDPTTFMSVFYRLSVFHHGCELVVEVIKVSDGKVHALNVGLHSFHEVFKLFLCDVANLRTWFNNKRDSLMSDSLPWGLPWWTPSFMRDLSSMVGGGKVGVGVTCARASYIYIYIYIYIHVYGLIIECGINKKQPSKDRPSHAPWKSSFLSWTWS